MGSILQFWAAHAPDTENGGFYGRIERDLTVVKDAPKGLVLNARILWTFAKAYRKFRDPRHQAMAERAFAYLQQFFRDGEYGGYYWMVDCQGRPAVTKKQTYGQAFVLYAVAEYALATGKPELVPLCEELFRLVERSFEAEHQGYIEALSRDWKPEADLRLGEHDMNVSKSMNTHLHVLEAYASAYRVWRSSELEQKLRGVINLMMNRVLDRNGGHFRLFFDNDWSLRSNRISYGHDIEGSWLLVEAAEVLGDPSVEAEVRKASVRMAEAVLAEGIDTDGGVLNEAEGETVTDDDKHWWPQAEAVVGFLNAYRLTGRKAFEEAALRAWDFIGNHIVDREYGEWFWKVNRAGEPDLAAPKVNEWKCPYHNARTCFEILDRLSAAKS